jgi:type I restriction enzyme S subunit
MDIKWFSTTIGEQATLQRGFDITKKEQRSGTVPVVSSSGIKSFHEVAKVKAPGVVLGRKGTLGSVFYLDIDFWPHDTSLYVKDFHGNNPKFVYYFFLNMSEDLLLLDNATANPALNRNHVHPIKVEWPELKGQEAIATILGALDEKIELNRQMNHTLEQMAQSLYKSWFVDFDPVVAKAAGKKPFGMSDGVAALFPDKFVDSEMGEIPEGWEILPFSKTVDIIGGGTPKTNVPEYWNGDILWFSVVDSPADGQIFVIDTEKKISLSGVNNSSTKLLSEGTTIITARGTVGKVALTGNQMTMNQSCYALHSINNYNYYTYLTTLQVVNELQQRAHGCVFDTIIKSTFDEINLVTSSRQIEEHFENSVKKHFEMVKANLFENQTLINLRNILLPKLLSGEIRLKQAETEVSKVV